MASQLLAGASDREIETVLRIAHDHYAIEDPSPGMLAAIFQNMREAQSEKATRRTQSTEHVPRSFNSFLDRRIEENDYWAPGEGDRETGYLPNSTEARFRHGQFADGGSWDWAEQGSQQDQSVVTREEHIPGINDTMSGAVHPNDDRRSSTNSDDATVAQENLQNAVQRMPFKLIGVKDLAQMQLFHDPGSLASIPNEWMTTIWGVCRALEEATAVVGNYYTDQHLLGALARRGGYAPEPKNVVYPEDLEPSIPQGHELYDAEYWHQVKMKGQIWETLGPGSDDDEDYGYESDGSGRSISDSEMLIRRGQW